MGTSYFVHPEGRRRAPSATSSHGSAGATISYVIGSLHVARDSLTLGEFVLSLACCALIGVLGGLSLLFPQSSYEWFVFKVGKDDFRRMSPERGRFQLWAHRISGLILLVAGIVLVVLLVLAHLPR